ncbi:MAG: hypothetical protein KAX66_02935, partial [Propionivibrio sp.]|nr:hypothetical protein [Propionivibrio sp.]
MGSKSDCDGRAIGKRRGLAQVARVDPFCVPGELFLPHRYCSGPMKYKVPVIPAKAGIQCRSAIADWTPAFAGVTNSNING